MHLDLWTLALQAINLAVLLALLRWLLYKPLMSVIDKRQHSVAEQLAAAASTQQQAAEERQALAAEHAAFDARREATLTEARQQADAERSALLASAKAAMQAEQAEARKRMAQERQQAGQALVTEASSMAVDLATRLVASSPTPLGDADFIDALLDHLNATPPQDRQRWLGCTQPAPVTLVSASTPSDATLRKVSEQLTSALGAQVTLHAQTRPSLLRGAELHFEHGVLSQSWAAELAAAQAEMQQASP
jgi:F-type H+-transporting ATPase subunit b